MRASRSACTSRWRGPTPASGNGTWTPTRSTGAGASPPLRPHPGARPTASPRSASSSTARTATASSARCALPTTAASSCSSSASGHPDGGERWIASRTRITRARTATGRSSAWPVTSPSAAGARTRWTFLDATGQALAASLDPVRTLNEVARLAVPRLADWCAVHSRRARAALENIAVAHVDPGKVRWARELQERYPPDPNVPTGVPEVIRSGRSELYPEIDEELLRRGARDEEHLEIIRELRIKSGMIVPLRARDQTLGAITFIYAESGRQYSTRELELAEELGRRAGLALDHARLYTREHRTAETLQRALLPPTLPTSPGTTSSSVTSRATSATTSAATGTTPSSCPAGASGSRSATSAAGDRAGRPDGPGARRAARVRVQGRRAGRGARRPARGSSPPPRAAITFATLTYIDFDLRTGAGALANAGHLPALVRGRTAPRFVDAPRCRRWGRRDPCTLGRFTLARARPCPLHRRPRRDAPQHRRGTRRAGRRGAPHRRRSSDCRPPPRRCRARHDDVALLGLRRVG